MQTPEMPPPDDEAQSTPAVELDSGDEEFEIDSDNHTAENLDAVIPPYSPNSLFVVGLGGAVSAIRTLHDFFSIMPPDSCLELSTALFGDAQRKEVVRVPGVPVEDVPGAEEDVKYIELRVRPVSDPGAPDRILFLVFFEGVSGNESTPLTALEAESLARKLYEEAQCLKANLRATVEQYEASVEELKASNEELQAMNEESRSTAEELETGKEELQSVNEELITVNQELKSSVEELARANSDLQNLMTSTEIATVFLDRAFIIVRYTPRAAQIFNIIPSDVGRPISDITHHMDYSELQRDAEQVLADLKTIEREVNTSDNRWFLVRLLPYRTGDDYIDGVVMTLLDITSRKRHEDEIHDLLHQIEQQSRIFNTTLTFISDFVYIFDRDGRFIYSNQPLLDLLGIKHKEIVGKNFHDLNYPEDLASRLQKQIQHVIDTAETIRDETPFTGQNGKGGFYEYIFTPVFDAEGKVESVAGSTRDVTERRQAEHELRESEERFRLLVEGTTDYAMFLMDTDRQIIHWNSGAERIFGYTREEAVGRSADIIFTPEDRAEGAPAKESLTAAAEGRAADIRWHLRKDGSRFWTDGIMSSLTDETGRLRGFAKIARDATKERLAEDELKIAHDELEARVQERTLELALTNDELRLESAQRLELEQTRQQLLERIVTTQEEERRRISRELHDQMGQQLTALLLGLKSLPSVLDEPAAAKLAPRLETLQALTDGLMEQVHNLAWELRPAVLDNLGLEAAIKQYAQQWSRECGVEADFVSRGFSRHKRLPLPIETVLYRVIQEALTNVHRHAEAQRVSILLERIQDQVVAIVEDDGKGFNTGKRDIADGGNGEGGKSARLGLLGMRERMELIGGTLTIESEAGGGTSVYARISGQEQNDV